MNKKILYRLEALSTFLDRTSARIWFVSPSMESTVKQIAIIKKLFFFWTNLYNTSFIKTR